MPILNSIWPLKYHYSGLGQYCTVSKIVFKVTRLRLHTTTYSKKDKYKSRYTIKKRSSEYKREQQGCQTAQRWVIDKKNDHRSKDGYNLKKSNGRRNHNIGRNQEKSNKKTESPKEKNEGQALDYDLNYVIICLNPYIYFFFLFFLSIFFNFL